MTFLQEVSDEIVCTHCGKRVFDEADDYFCLFYRVFFCLFWRQMVFGASGRCLNVASKEVMGQNGRKEGARNVVREKNLLVFIEEDKDHKEVEGDKECLVLKEEEEEDREGKEIEPG